MTDDKTKLMRVFSHPLRRSIFKEMYRGAGQPASPRQIAERLDESLSNVSYHVRVLKDHGLIQLSRTQEARGTIAHFYICSPAVTDDPWVRQTLGLDDGDPPTSS